MQLRFPNGMHLGRSMIRENLNRKSPLSRNLGRLSKERQEKTMCQELYKHAKG